MKNEIIKIDLGTFNANQNSLTKLVDDALAGMVNELDAYLFLKKLETTVKNGLSLLQDGATDEAIKYGKGEHLVDGAYINVKASAGRWQFSDKVKELKEVVKAREELEKSAYKAGDNIIVDPDGVQVEPAQWFPGKEIVSVKIPKI